MHWKKGEFMTKTRFIVSIIITLLITLWGVIFGGNNVLLYWDAPSFMIVPIMPYIIASLIYPPKEQIKFKKEVFKPAGDGDKKELEKAISFCNTFRNLVILFALIGAFIGFIGILGNIQNIDNVAKSVGVMSICGFYAVIFIILLIEPLKAAAKKNLIG